MENPHDDGREVENGREKPVSVPRRPVPPRGESGIYSRGQKAVGLRDHRVRMMSRRLKKALPWVQTADFPLLRSWCELEVLCTRIYKELRERKTLVVAGEHPGVIKLVEDYYRLRRTQLHFTRELGMSPASRRTLKGSVESSGFDLVQAFASASSDGEEVVESSAGAGDSAAAVEPGNSEASSETPEPATTVIDDDSVF